MKHRSFLLVDEDSVSHPTIGNVTSCHFVVIGINSILRGVAVGTCFDVILLLLCSNFCLLLIGFLVEVSEEEIEHNCVHSNPPDEGFGIVAVDEK